MAAFRPRNGFSTRSRGIVPLACVAVVAAWSGVLLAGDDPKPGPYPRLPDGVEKPPEWLTKDAPFDVVKFFTPPPVEQNAAPLYLDALFEFANDVGRCFPEAERKRRRAIVDKRSKRYYEIEQLLEKNPKAVTREKVDALLAEYETGFNKLAEAQKRPRCMFATGIGIASLLPHAGSARQVVRILDLRTRRDAVDGNLGRAAEGVEMVLRFSRDLRPRGFFINQLVSVAMDGITTGDVILRILIGTGLTVEQCDRLLAALEKHESAGPDMFQEGLKAEYLTARKFLHDVEHRTGDFGRDFHKQWGMPADTTIGELLARIGASFPGGPDKTRARLVDRELARITAADYRKLVEFVNDSHPELARLPQQSPKKQAETLDKLTSRAKQKSFLLAQVWPPALQSVIESFVRHKARLAGTKCLIAVRRWQLAEKKPLPQDLLTIVQAAGMKCVPIDPYSGEPMKLTFIKDEPVIYSVGSDGKDDKGRRDWRFGQQPGDFLFRLRLPASASADKSVETTQRTPPAEADEPFRYPEATHGKGELKYVNGIPVLLVQGLPEEMGTQAGVLALKPASGIVELADQFVKDQGWESIYGALLKTANVLGPRLPPDHLNELDAAAKASGWSRELLLFANTIPDLRKLGGCSALIVEGRRSTTGGPLFGRNVDWPPSRPLHEYPLVVVYRPAGKRAFASVTYPGVFGCFSGMNDAGLALADLTVNSAKDGSPALDLTGTAYTLALRRVLEECETVEEAEKLLRSMKRTTMQNVAICDKEQGAVFEITTKSLVVRRAPDGVCACTNHFRTEELATVAGCRRYEILDKSREFEKFSVATVARQMDAVNQGASTIQTMIFETATLRLHLAFGKGPATRLPLCTLELADLFATGQYQKTERPDTGPP